MKMDKKKGDISMRAIQTKYLNVVITYCRIQYKKPVYSLNR